MGYNTTVVVLNDALGSIKDDPEFGKKLVSAILQAGSSYNHSKFRENGYHEIIDVSAGNFVNAAHVVETHHADEMALIAVGGNLGQRVGGAHGAWALKGVEILKRVADVLGYRLVKKSR